MQDSIFFKRSNFRLLNLEKLELRMEEVEEIYEEESAVSLNNTLKAGAYENITNLFSENRSSVFYSRQVEVMFEGDYFHWVTNRVLRSMASRRELATETRKLRWGPNIILYWHPSFRYYKREARKIVETVEKYSADKIGSSVGHHGELMVLEGFAKIQFVVLGRNVNELEGKKWRDTGHNLDMIIARDGIKYGIEVKNTLGYIEKGEFEAKIDLCDFLGLKPVFAVRMLPKNWVKRLVDRGGYALVLKYLLYPELLDDLATEMRNLNLPVDTPKSLYGGTMARFEKWHKKHVK